MTPAVWLSLIWVGFFSQILALPGLMTNIQNALRTVIGNTGAAAAATSRAGFRAGRAIRRAAPVVRDQAVRAARAFLWAVLAYVLFSIGLLVLTIYAINNGSGRMVAVLCFIQAALTMPIFFGANAVTEWFDKDSPAALADIPLILLNMAICAFAWPRVFFGDHYLGFMLILVTLGVANSIRSRVYKSKKAYAPWVLNLLIAGMLVIWIGMWVGGVDVEAYSAKLENRNRGESQQTLLQKVQNRLPNKVTAEKAYLFRLIDDGRGHYTPEIAKDEHGAARLLKQGDPFKTLDVEVKSVGDIDQFIPVVLPDSVTKKYLSVPVNPSDRIYLAADDTDVPANPNGSSASNSSSSNNKACVISYPSGSCWTAPKPTYTSCGDTSSHTPSVVISDDGLTAKLVVTPNLPNGLPATDSKGRSLQLHAGDEVSISVQGSIGFSSEHPCVDYHGMKDWRDPSVDSPFTDSVGGLEASLSGQKYLVDDFKTASSDGVPVFRTIDRIDGYTKPHPGAFLVTITVKRKLPAAPIT